MRFQCPECKGIVAADNADMGSAVQCGHCGMEVSVPASRVSPGSVVGDFVIMHELGRGGMGIVYKAHQLSLDRSAALKILSENYANNTEFVVGFIKEARAAAKLNHPNVVQAYAVGDDEGLFYFAMELVEGETMKSILKQRNVIPWKESVGIILQVAEALDYAWQEERLVHRDVKPDNIMLTAGGKAKLADLGLAKVGEDADGSTDSDEVMGTPQYISPEQLTGDPLDCRTDIYSLGATFYQFLTGRFPYDGDSAVEISRQHLEGTLIPVNEVNPEVPENVARVVEKMMAKDPAMRYSTPGDLAEDLTRIKHGLAPEIATVSTALKIQISNREEAENAADLPAFKKLTASAAASSAGTETLVETPVEQNEIPKARPRLSIRKAEEASPKEPAKPAPAPAPVPAPANTTPAKEEPKASPSVKKPALAKPSLAKPAAPTPPTPPAPAPVPAPANTTPAKEEPKAPEKNQEKKKKKQQSSGSSGGKVVLWILLSLVVLLGVFAAYLYFSGKFGAFLEGVKKQDAASTLAALEGEKPPPPSEYELAASRLVEQIRKSISGGDSALAGQCRTFLLSGKVPGNDKEKQLETTIVEYFASADEEQIENARLKKIREYEAEIIRKEAAAAEAARLRQIEELRRRDARIKQQEQEALRREAENKRKAAQRIVTNFKNRMTAYEQRIYRELNPYSEKNDIAGYKKLLESNLAEAGKAPPEFKVHTRTMVNKTREMERMLTPAWDWQKLLVDGDAAVEGLDITIRFDLCKVTAIRAGVLYAQTVSGKEIRVPVEKILRTKAFVKFLVNLGYKNKKLGSLPFFFFWRNEPVIAKMIARECSAREQALYRNFVLNYLRNALPGRHRGKLIRKFGSTDEYKALMPRPKVVPRKAPPKKVAAKKAPPKKAPVKKAPVKKTAPKKK